MTQSQQIGEGVVDKPLTPAEVATLLHQIRELLQGSDLPTAEKEKVIRSVGTAKDEVQADEPDTPMETAKLFMSGNSQAVRLPKNYRFSGDEVVIKRLGNAVILLPKEDPWQVMFDALREFPDDLILERNQPLLQERESIE